MLDAESPAAARFIGMRAWLLIAIAVEWIGLPLIGSAQAPELELELRVESDPARCIEESALRERVKRWLAPGAWRAASPVAVRVATEPPGFTLLRDGRIIAERRFAASAAPCADRIDALALAIAVALEQVGSGAPESAAAARARTGSTGAARRSRSEPPAAPAAALPEPAPAPAPEAAPAVAAPPAQSEPPAPEASAAVRFALHAGGGVLLGVLREPVFAGGAGVELLLASPLRAGITALFTAENSAPLASGRVEARLLGARALGCFAPAAGAFGLETCGGLAAGVVSARGRGFSDQHDTRVAWFAPLLRAALRYPGEGSVAVRLAADGMLNAVRPTFAVRRGEARPSAAAPPVSAAASLELLVALP